MKKHILLIDKDKNSFRPFIEAFRGMELSIECTYTDCWRQATLMLEYLTVDAILIHLDPFVADHLQFVRTLKRHKKFRRTGIAVYSQHISYYNHLARAHGADKCVVKPQGAEDMKTIVLSMLSWKEDSVHQNDHHE